ncbi:divergent polysaccharide deacetylase family protein [Pseudemcibacter aquimaris]|uniref:divergent polysaccharide deacetylase family protein n=1 Tax=Pseudemcibacter aquimaris TaxID=2857064 RepID=UPI0020139671|nr:divergent polysaccharide deacetylase family protein [Pseudemcibacter aquimaris]MCC3859912.1 divergent polysaccharide deacetylase family protein [Pseudemcibacter aquimaris]WDU57244.1 divergent polysaccharide deacetylase family protein [Pseudemcibacter aquimaris]
MDEIEPIKPKRRKPTLKYAMGAFYFLFIGFCAVGILLKWNELTRKEQYRYAYHEGTISTATLPYEGPSFLERLTNRYTRKAPPIKLPERNDRAGQRWQKFAAAPVPVPAGHDTVVIVIDDLGIVKDMTAEMIDMDVPMTLAFLPYASDVSPQANRAYNKGHDILVHIPMEPKSRLDPGPNALLSSTPVNVQMDSIHYNLSQFENYIGINNHMGSRFTEDSSAVNRLLGVVKDSELLVLDSKTTPNSVLESLADQNEIPVINRDVFLDNTEDEQYIMGQLARLERIAKQTGNGVAIGHPYPETVAALKKWLPTLADKGITVVPISQKVREKYAATLLAKNQ